MNHRSDDGRDQIRDEGMRRLVKALETMPQDLAERSRRIRDRRVFVRRVFGRAVREALRGRTEL